MSYKELLTPIHAFLGCKTPQAWIELARRPEHLPTLLIDHANCELKAAQSAMLLIRRYAVDEESGKALLAWLKPYEDFTYRQIGDWHQLAEQNRLTKAMLPRTESAQQSELIEKMVLLIKEELHHFFQVLEILEARGIDYQHLTSSRYARGLFREVRTHEPATLVDKLICGAFIEARSCERFAALAAVVDDDLSRFYTSLLRSEARHYQDYLTLAQNYASPAEIEQRIADFRICEANLIQQPDSQLRFHSGVPLAAASAEVAA